jgi:hypothetical protein
MSALVPSSSIPEVSVYPTPRAFPKSLISLKVYATFREGCGKVSYQFQAKPADTPLPRMGDGTLGSGFTTKSKWKCDKMLDFCHISVGETLLGWEFSQRHDRRHTAHHSVHVLVKRDCP